MAEAISGAESAGMTVKVYHLNDPGIRGCQACHACRERYGCATEDYLTPMYDDLSQASAVIFASPNYYFQITGQAKLWLDRTLPLLGEDSSGGFQSRFPGKKVVALYSQGNPDVTISRGMIDGMNKVFDLYGWTVIACLVATGKATEGTPAFNDLLWQAHEAGAALALDGD